jgi:hypothetical protein
VYRGNQTNSLVIEKYLKSLYWALQTLTTVGYGNFGFGNLTELLLNLFWMFGGVSFNSFVIGAVTSLISAELENTESLNYKIKVLLDFSEETGME